MKTKHIPTKLKPGMTLIEITVVILVLLTLISVLFIGANIYKNGADRAACILNIRNVQQAVRAHQNLNALSVGDALDLTEGGDIFSSDTKELYLSLPECPGGGDYTAGQVSAIPASGVLVYPCSLSASDEHVPSNINGW